MKKIFSKIYPKKLLHLIVKPSDFHKKITEITDKDISLQCIAIKMRKGDKISPHRHLKKKCISPTYFRIQESWCVVAGSARGYFYDMNNKLISTVLLKRGYASFTFQGGHSFKALTNKTIIYEYKKGPYKINFNDKVYIK